MEMEDLATGNDGKWHDTHGSDHHDMEDQRSNGCLVFGVWKCSEVEDWLQSRTMAYQHGISVRPG